jgi:hypothetical protein
MASVVHPCQTRTTADPHVQVIPGQQFQLEWSVGHGDSGTTFSYFVLLKATDYDQLKLAQLSDIDDYLNWANVPSNGWVYNTTNWQKRHVGKPNMNNTTPIYGYFYPSGTPGYALAKADPWYIQRDPVMVYTLKSWAKTNSDQYRFLPNQTTLDVRASYLSTKYPWIISAAKFKNVIKEHDIVASEHDIANFEIPSAVANAPGDYIMWFYWAGYKDCVDINVPVNNFNSKTNVQYRYGANVTGATANYFKIDHCEFRNVLGVAPPGAPFYRGAAGSCYNVGKGPVLDASVCTKLCTQQGGSCAGVAVVRKTNPAGTIDHTPNIPTIAWDGNQVDFGVFPPQITGPCGRFTQHGRMKAGCTQQYTQCANVYNAAAGDDYICYPVSPYRDQDFQATEDYINTDDPADPRYYSSCWFKKFSAGFVNLPPLKGVLDAWQQQEACLDCQTRLNFFKYKVNQTAAVAWAQAVKLNTGSDGICYDCDALGQS